MSFLHLSFHHTVLRLRDTPTKKMFLFCYVGALAALSTAVLTQEVAPDEVRAASIYRNGQRHSEIIARKQVNHQYSSKPCGITQLTVVQATWDNQRAAGAMKSAQYKPLGYTRCVDGLADAAGGDPNNTFRCNNVCVLSKSCHNAQSSRLTGKPGGLVLFQESR